MTVFMLYWFGFMALWLVVGAGTYLAISVVSGKGKRGRRKQFVSGRYDEEAKAKFYALQLEEIVDTWKGDIGAEQAEPEDVEMDNEPFEEEKSEEAITETEIKDFQNAELKKEMETFSSRAIEEEEAEEVTGPEEAPAGEEVFEDIVPEGSRSDIPKRDPKKWRTAEDVFAGLFKS